MRFCDTMYAMKTGLIVAGIVILAAIAYFAFVQPATAPTTTDSQGKVDINAVCEGALAYMTFPSGVAAEAWVAECKEGKHPEAIQEWKIRMGITDDRAI